jgi:D-arabinose 1-dehydrogenase-like Zn-dependent alcohol dehydrogenase
MKLSVSPSRLERTSRESRLVIELVSAPRPEVASTANTVKIVFPTERFPNVDHEQYCDAGQVGTYNSVYNDGSKSYGGYADYTRVPGHFAIPIPDGLPSEVAAPMLCGGITTYSPIKAQGAGPGKTVGIVGIGGLGHFGLIWAKALGADVVAISTSDSKKADAEKMGATGFIATSKGKSVFKENRRTLDFIGIRPCTQF